MVLDVAAILCRWVDQHHTLERLNAQAHVNARNRSDPFVLEALITFDKLPTVVEMLVTAEAWIDRVFPRLEGRLPDDRSMRAYYMVSALCRGRRGCWFCWGMPA